MMAEPLAAALHGVAKHYHGFTLGPLNLEIPAGSIVGLIGENGAGKTTLLKLLTGVNRPDAGTVELLSATPDDAAVRAKIGVVFEDAYFYESLTPAQVGASLRGIFGPAWDTGYFAALLEQFHLPPRKSIKELSRGMRMKLNFASALAHRPGLLVLDEATSGLDPAARSEILDILLDFIQDERHSVLLSSHITTDLEQIADTIAYLHHGQLLFAKNKDDLMEEYGILRCSQQDLDRLPPEWIAATGRTAAGVLTWGFNSTNFGNMLFRATPLIMTGLSVAVAFKTGLFNIGAPGQYLMGTLVSLCIALGIPSSSVAPWLIWILALPPVRSGARSPARSRRF